MERITPSKAFISRVWVLVLFLVISIISSWSLKAESRVLVSPPTFLIEGTTGGVLGLYKRGRVLMGDRDIEKPPPPPRGNRTPVPSPENPPPEPEGPPPPPPPPPSLPPSPPAP